MSESSSKVESQLSFFGENAFTNLSLPKMEGVKEFSEDEEFSKEDEEMVEIKPLDERSNDLAKFTDAELEPAKHETSQNHETSQFKENEIERLVELNQLNNLSQLSEAPQLNVPHIEQPNDTGYSADEPRNETERIAAPPVNASSLLVSKSPAEQSPGGEPKPEPTKPADNQQHLLSSLNSLIQQSNSQQNNQFSQVSLF